MERHINGTTALELAIGAGLLTRVREVWFSHVAEEDSIIVPTELIARRWFSQTEEFDALCLNEFGHVLSVTEWTALTGADVVAIANPKNSLEWMSLIIFLDQIPRNIFRGRSARLAYESCDKIALEVALVALTMRIPEQTPVRFAYAYRFWFYMPLEHSEDLKIQDRLALEQNKMVEDTYALLRNPDIFTTEDPRISHFYGVLSRQHSDIKAWFGLLRGIARQHRDVLEKFGRYPWRNDALGRTSTTEELVYLRKGLPAESKGSS